MHRISIVTAAATGALALAPAAGAKVTPTHSARSVARAIVASPQLLRGASWVEHPPRGNWAATSTSRYVGFPRSGPSFGLLSSGSARLIGRPDSSGSLSTDNDGPLYRGTRDAVVLRIGIDVPAGARCLSLRFRFLSEEYPEYVHTGFNDAFIAELDRTRWTAATGGPRIHAPGNFARVRDGRLVSVNGAGAFAVTRDRARGTTYDAGTRRLRASRPITPGRHDVYLTIFDQGDHQFDSTVVLDGLTANRRTPCVSGASLD
jgi:hypothetical protein